MNKINELTKEIQENKINLKTAEDKLAQYYKAGQMEQARETRVYIDMLINSLSRNILDRHKKSFCK